MVMMRMSRVETSLEIEASMEKVFAFLADSKNHEKVFSDADVKVEMLSKDPIGVRTSYRNHGYRRTKGGLPPTRIREV